MEPLYIPDTEMIVKQFLPIIIILQCLFVILSPDLALYTPVVKILIQTVNVQRLRRDPLDRIPLLFLFINPAQHFYRLQILKPVIRQAR